MKTSTKMLLLTTAMAIFSIGAIYSGFFLTNTKVSNTSSLVNLLHNDKPWFDRKTKVVFLLIDALRFDYLPMDVTMNITKNDTLPFHHNFENLHKKMLDHPDNFTIVKIHADAPTWTANRLPAIATGSIPPAADLMQLIHPTALPEDSFLRQMKNAGLKSYFAGDPIWTDFFPDCFTEEFIVKGLNIKNKNQDKIPEEKVKEWVKKNDFDFILGYLLGIDHAGHLGGLLDPELKRQQKMSDAFVSELIDMLDEDTVLIITGDHGMTIEGSHGRSSPEETTTVMMAYSKRGFQKYQETGLESIMKSTKENNTVAGSLQQDLTSTFSMLMGIPIAYSNLGSIINDVYPLQKGWKKSVKPADDASPDCSMESNELLVTLVHNNLLNAKQLKNYFDHYNTLTALFSTKEINDIENLVSSMNTKHNSLMHMINNPKECKADFKQIGTNIILDVQKLSRNIYEMTRTKASYDLAVCIEGLIILTMVAFLYMLIVQYYHNHGFDENSKPIRKPERSFWRPTALFLSLISIFLIEWLITKRLMRPLTTMVLCFTVFVTIAFLYSIIKGNKNFKKDQSNDDTPISSSTFLSQAGDKVEKIKGIVYKIFRFEELEMKDVSPGSPVERNLNQSLVEHHDFEIDIKSALCEESEEKGKRPFSYTFKLGPVFLILTAAVIVFCLMQLQTPKFEDFRDEFGDAHMQYFLIGAACLRFIVTRKNMMLNGVALAISALALLIDANSITTRNVVAIGFISDWIYNETEDILNTWTNKQKNLSRAFSSLQMASYITLALYYLTFNLESSFTGIILPRFLWALLVASILVTFIGKMPKRARIASLQLSLVHLLLLVQDPENVISIVFIICAMNILAETFLKRVSTFSYLFAIMLATFAHFGFFISNHTDRKLPNKFNVGFVGLHDYQVVLSTVFLLLNYVGAYVLGLIFISYYSRKLDSTYLKTQTAEGEVDEKTKAQEIQLIQRSHVVLFQFFFCVVFYAAVVKCFVWKDYNLDQASEKFAVDACIYLFVAGSSLLLF